MYVSLTDTHTLSWSAAWPGLQARSSIQWGEHCQLLIVYGGVVHAHPYRDDHQILKWDFKSGETTQVAPLNKGTYVTQIDWLPVTGGGGARKPSGQPELFVLTCTDGKSEACRLLFDPVSSLPRSIPPGVKSGSCGEDSGGPQRSCSRSTLES